MPSYANLLLQGDLETWASIASMSKMTLHEQQRATVQPGVWRMRGRLSQGAFENTCANVADADLVCGIALACAITEQLAC